MKFYITRIEYSIKKKSSKHIFVFILFISNCIKEKKQNKTNTTRERERKPQDDKITK